TPFCARRRPQTALSLIFAEEHSALELAPGLDRVPAQRVDRDGLPRCHRASPSTALDKLALLYRTSRRSANMSKDERIFRVKGCLRRRRFSAFGQRVFQLAYSEWESR